MKVVSKKSELGEILSGLKHSGAKIGLVPTMGALHRGHLSLIEIAKEKSNQVVVSIFINPLQFNSAKDFNTYPQTLEEDLGKCREVGTDIVFAPKIEEIYTKTAKMESGRSSGVRLVAGNAAQGLCGAGRPGHFDGVVTVVSILFNIVRPDFSVFGEKDFQQLKVIEEMVKDLAYPIEIVPAPLVRDSDGLALSSRNMLLSAEGRFHALYISKSLFKARQMVESGERNVETLIAIARENLEKPGGLLVEYIEIVDSDSLKAIREISNGARMLIAAKAGEVRLIDNICLA